MLHKTRKHKDHRFVFQQNNVMVQQYSKILPDLSNFGVNIPEWPARQLLSFVVLDLMIL